MSDPYHVLARKYRPLTFTDLMGQDVLVKTLKNAIEKRRIPHAILLTGVRGIGKTTTARIIARSLNCIGPDGQGTETIHPCGQCQPCVDILKERHLDVIEMDAASRTSVDDIRRVIDAAYYKPSSARYKIQIIDEVHMLTKQAFNALLKTLEEPPEYTKFIFATTELNRVPDTIISRCVRFDLKRFDRQTLEALLQKTCHQESVTFDEDAIRLLAIAANGSARDAQSLLERAISLSDEGLETASIRNMLGLTGQADNLEILSAVLQGQTQKALSTFHRLYDNGADPDHILSALCDLVHTISLYTISSDFACTTGLSTEDLEIIQSFSSTLTVPLLTRLWQVLTKGRDELKGSPSVKQAVDMILIRACYLSDQPTAQAVLKQLSGQAPQPAAVKDALPAPVPSADISSEAQKKSPDDVERGQSPEPKRSPDNDSVALSPIPPLKTFQDVVDLFETNKEPLLTYELENHVCCDHMDPTAHTLTLSLTNDAKPGLIKIIQDHLSTWTNCQWRVKPKAKVTADSQGIVTLRDQKRQAKADLIATAQQTPLVREALKTFPGAVIKDVKAKQ